MTDKEIIADMIIAICKKLEISIMVNMELDLSQKDTDLSIKHLCETYRISYNTIIGKGEIGKAYDTLEDAYKDCKVGDIVYMRNTTFYIR